MKRQILYKPGTKIDEPKEKKTGKAKPPKKEPPPVISNPDPKPENMPIVGHQEKIALWLADHKLFKIGGMCGLLDIDPANFSRYIKLKAIPDAYLPKIVNILKEYGYAG